MSTTDEDRMLGEILGQNGGMNPGQLLAALAGRRGNGKVYNPDVEREGDKVIIPEGAHLPDVIRALERQHKREEEVIKVRTSLPVTPWDGAMAVTKAIEEKFGVLNQRPDSYGDLDMIDVEVDLNKTVQVPFGNFELPGMEDAQVVMGFGREDGRIIFNCTIECKRKYEARVRRLMEHARELAITESLHRGKAFTIEFRDSEGDYVQLPKPKFFPVAEEEPVFRDALHDRIERNVFTPIRHAAELRGAGKSLKRGVLFAGPYGTGKTMLASHIAKVATEAGWTFIYVKDSTELNVALEYAQQYQPVVVFAEDVDRVAGPKRDGDVNNLLNQLDGIDSKSAEIMTVLTSNHADRINPAMRRPGRIDMVLPVEAPDAVTVERMIRRFAAGSLANNASLADVSAIMEGETAARIRETIQRAELEALRRTGKANARITGKDLAAAANDVKAEIALFQSDEGVNAETAEVVSDQLYHMSRMVKGSAQHINGAQPGYTNGADHG